MHVLIRRSVSSNTLIILSDILSKSEILLLTPSISEFISQYILLGEIDEIEAEIEDR